MRRARPRRINIQRAAPTISPPLDRHGRACPGHPETQADEGCARRATPRTLRAQCLWVAGTSPAMTIRGGREDLNAAECRSTLQREAGRGGQDDHRLLLEARAVGAAHRL